MYSVKFNTTDYTEVIIKGAISASEYTDGAVALVSIGNYCYKNKVEKLFVIFEITGSTSFMSIKSNDLSSSFHYFGLNKDLKIAFIDSINDKYDTNSIVRTNYVNKNVLTIKDFDNSIKAVNWLFQ